MRNLENSSVSQDPTIDVIYYYIIWTDGGSMLPEANTLRQEGKYPTMKVLQGCILSYYYIQSIQCPSITGQAICNLPYFYSIVASSSLAMWALFYQPADAMLYQSICSLLHHISCPQLAWHVKAFSLIDSGGRTPLSLMGSQVFLGRSPVCGTFKKNCKYLIIS